MTKTPHWTALDAVNIGSYPFAPWERGDVFDAVWALVGRCLPLIIPKDSLYVSPEVRRDVPDAFDQIVETDERLHGLEMRLVRR
jgi:hypothetical protein